MKSEVLAVADAGPPQPPAEDIVNAAGPGPPPAVDGMMAPRPEQVRSWFEVEWPPPKRPACLTDGGDYVLKNPARATHPVYIQYIYAIVVLFGMLHVVPTKVQINQQRCIFFIGVGSARARGGGVWFAGGKPLNGT